MAPTREAWADAFAMQSRSDWEVYERLSRAENIPPCHKLHYLQMACEKIAKAYRLRDTSADVEQLLSRHVGFDKFITSFLGSPAIKQTYKGRGKQLARISESAKLLASEIQKLAPAVDRSNPVNAEYPWAWNNGDVVPPCKYDYPSLSLLMTPGGVTFLKFVERAISEFDRIQLT